MGSSSSLDFSEAEDDDDELEDEVGVPEDVVSAEAEEPSDSSIKLKIENIYDIYNII